MVPSLFLALLCVEEKAVGGGGGNGGWRSEGTKWPFDCMFVWGRKSVRGKLETMYRFSVSSGYFIEKVTHSASLSCVTWVSFVQGLYAESMLYRRMCMASTWNSWSERERRGGENKNKKPSLSCSWRGQNQRPGVMEWWKRLTGTDCGLMARLRWNQVRPDGYMGSAR